MDFVCQLKFDVNRKRRCMMFWNLLKSTYKANYTDLIPTKTVKQFLFFYRNLWRPVMSIGKLEFHILFV